MTITIREFLKQLTKTDLELSDGIYVAVGDELIPVKSVTQEDGELTLILEGQFERV